MKFILLSTVLFLSYKKNANKCVNKPHIIFSIMNISKFKTIGLYKKDTKKPIQKELHSGHIKGFLMYGILEITFLMGLNISEKLHITEKLRDRHIKYNISNNFISLVYKSYTFSLKHNII